MNKKQREELSILAKRFGRIVTLEKDLYGYEDDIYLWEEMSASFFDWLQTIKHDFDMNIILDYIIKYGDKLKSKADHEYDYDEGPYSSKRHIWEEMYKKFINFCGLKK